MKEMEVKEMGNQENEVTEFTKLRDQLQEKMNSYEEIITKLKSDVTQLENDKAKFEESQNQKQQQFNENKEQVAKELEATAITLANQKADQAIRAMATAKVLGEDEQYENYIASIKKAVDEDKDRLWGAIRQLLERGMVLPIGGNNTMQNESTANSVSGMNLGGKPSKTPETVLGNDLYQSIMTLLDKDPSKMSNNMEKAVSEKMEAEGDLDNKTSPDDGMVKDESDMNLDEESKDPK